MSTERAYVWCGMAGITLVFVGLFIAHLLPPPSPGEGSHQIATFFQSHTDEIRWGTILVGLGGAMLAPWLGVITKQIAKIEGHGKAAAYCQLALGALLVFELILPIIVGQVVVFRPHRPASETLLLSDLFFVLLISPAYTLVIELSVTAAAILTDKSAIPVFERWIGWVNVATAVLSLPALTVIFFKYGPWAWNGLFGLWIPAVAFGLWMMSMTYSLLKSPAPASRIA